MISVVLLAAALGVANRGHFIKPHGDFYEFRETGHAILRGALPPTFKRAPVYPLVVAATGNLLHRIAATDTPADQLAAEWINALLLPANAALLLLLGWRWGGGGARWAAWWFALLPIGLYCTAHTLVEPLLVATCLLTVFLAERGSKWAYLAAAVATMTRYDAAGLIIGVALADGLRSRTWRRPAGRALLALLPLLIWLGLTALTWPARSADHYLRQLVQTTGVDFAWPLVTTLDCVFGPRSLTVPVWFAEWEPYLRGTVSAGLLVLTLLGLIRLLRRRAGGLIAALVLAAGYIAVHAVFPFREGFDRFCYPLAVLLLAVAGAGGGWLAGGRWWGRRAGAWRLLGVVAGLGAGVWLWGEGGRLASLWRLGRYEATPLPALAIAGTLLVWAAGWQRGAGRTGRVVAVLLMLAVAVTQMRLALPALGDGRERVNDVRAARWIRDHVAAEDGVLSPSPGLLRLYMPERPANRFVGLGEIEAEQWPEILAECRRRHIRYIIWHDQVFSEQGAYYIRKWRLGRFTPLEQPGRLAGVEVVQRFRDRPNLWILRLRQP